MKTTIDIPEEIYRKVKVKSAMEGRPMRDVAIMLFSEWVDQTDSSVMEAETDLSGIVPPDAPVWFASLRKYARNARGRYDMDSIRHSIERGRPKDMS